MTDHDRYRMRLVVAASVRPETRRRAAAKGQLTKVKKRVGNGVCPCCTRSFTDLARHMESKHPAYVERPNADA